METLASCSDSASSDLDLHLLRHGIERLAERYDRLAPLEDSMILDDDSSITLRKFPWNPLSFSPAAEKLLTKTLSNQESRSERVNGIRNPACMDFLPSPSVVYRF